MASFGDVARQRQDRFRNESPTISLASRAQKRGRGHLLAKGRQIDNLYPTLRGENGALKFFADRNIKWWGHPSSRDYGDANRPTHNMTSSQIFCVNFLLPLSYIDGALTAVLRAIDYDVRQVVPIYHRGNTSMVEFEWIGLYGALEGALGRMRGDRMTSIDALVIAETDSGRRAYFMEWKYTESYDPDDYKGNTRHYSTYSNLYTAESSSFNGDIPMDELMYEPFYQLLRQRLLADGMVNYRDLGVSDAKVITVVPADNTAYRESITSPSLRNRFPNLKTVSEVFRATLKHPDAAYAMICPSALVDAVAREHGGAAADWIAYQRERYGL